LQKQNLSTKAVHEITTTISRQRTEMMHRQKV